MNRETTACIRTEKKQDGREALRRKPRRSARIYDGISGIDHGDFAVFDNGGHNGSEDFDCPYAH